MMRLVGYKSELEFVLYDVEEEQKEKFLLWYSEKLVVVYGCLKLFEGLWI